ncbi:uncharacterized protein BKA78DRAFT_71680 [Phyllosticta capitalensis]|uniref:uncharacterized protein n=1 Tax=Phyllosticta capitalensis TaxID=121624 RepID=UPI003131C66B
MVESGDPDIDRQKPPGSKVAHQDTPLEQASNRSINQSINKIHMTFLYHYPKRHDTEPAPHRASQANQTVIKSPAFINRASIYTIPVVKTTPLTSIPTIIKQQAVKQTEGKKTLRVSKPREAIHDPSIHPSIHSREQKKQWYHWRRNSKKGAAHKGARYNSAHRAKRGKRNKERRLFGEKMRRGREREGRRK